MLCDLRISNFAIIESQAVSFGPGLNVISGETGAGKSIVLQALEMVLGGRPRAQFLREGSDGWEVEALFDLTGLAASVRNEIPDIASGDELVVHRSLTRGGRGKIYINGHLSSVALLEEITGRVMNICSQGQKNRLLESRYHLELVDGFAGTKDLFEQYRALYSRWRQLEKELELRTAEREKAEARREELESSVAELSGAKLRAGLRAELEDEVKKLGSAEQIIKTLDSIGDALRGDRGITAQLAALGQEFNQLAKLDPAGGDDSESYRSILENLRELTRKLEQRASRISTDEKRLEDFRDRLAEVARLERKYRRDCSGLIALLDESRRELSLLETAANLDVLRREVQEAENEVRQAAAALSRKRVSLLEKLSKAVEQDLAELNMKGARLKIAHQEVSPGPTGIDQLEIFIAPNQGEGFKALGQIASGGELSRILLVLKKVLREQTGVNVLVFDEVDAGISGAVARSVGEKLRELARSSQVLCITHLAQVASLADHHFCVAKQSGPRTVSTLRELKKEDEKVEEIARMLAGYKVSAASRESARELLSSK